MTDFTKIEQIDRAELLMHAMEGELDGLTCDKETAIRILAHVDAGEEGVPAARQVMTHAAGGITLSSLRAANIARQREWCPDQVPDLSFRGNELAGEVGEACNVIKKLERERMGWAGSRATKEQLAEELADAVICADLAAMAAGVDLASALVRKFNATSEKVGLTTRLEEIPSYEDGLKEGLRRASEAHLLPRGSDKGGWTLSVCDLKKIRENSGEYGETCDLETVEAIALSVQWFLLSLLTKEEGQ